MAKLVEILAKELGEWPEGVAAMAQDYDGDVQNYSDTQDIFFAPDGYACGGSRIPYSYAIRGAELATDHATAIVTREMWQAERNKQSCERVEDVAAKHLACIAKDSCNVILMRDRIREIDATIEAMTAERAELVSKLAGEGFALIAVAVAAEPDEDMSDWRNWKAVDNIECVSIEGKHCSEIHIGGIYTYTGDGGFNDDAGDEQKYALRHGGCFKWHSRPSA